MSETQSIVVGDVGEGITKDYLDKVIEGKARHGWRLVGMLPLSTRISHEEDYWRNDLVRAYLFFEKVDDDYQGQ